MARKILLPIDLDTTGTGINRAALQQALRLLDDDGQLVLVTVLPDYGLPMVSDRFEPEHSGRARDAARAALAQWIAANVPKAVDSQAHVLTGTIYDEIIRAADRLGADLIIIGAHRPGFTDYLLGSNAARVVRHARQSVYVVRVDGQ